MILEICSCKILNLGETCSFCSCTCPNFWECAVATFKNRSSSKRQLQFWSFSDIVLHDSLGATQTFRFARAFFLMNMIESEVCSEMLIAGLQAQSVSAIVAGVMGRHGSQRTTDDSPHTARDQRDQLFGFVAPSLHIHLSLRTSCPPKRPRTPGN